MEAEVAEEEVAGWGEERSGGAVGAGADSVARGDEVVVEAVGEGGVT